MNKNKLGIAIISLIIDQVLKHIIELYNVKYVIIDKIFSIDYCTNTGAAFSILKDKTIILTLISIVVLILVYNLSFSFKDNKLSDLSFGLLYGGIVSNLIDRVLFGYVRDFISIGNFPVFNVADMCIVVGIFLITFITIMNEYKERKGSDSCDNKSRRRNRRKN